MEITRSGARPGDEIYVSGELGGAALAVFLKSNATHLTDPLLESDSFMKLDYPQPRVELGCSLAGVATSMLDLSDGLSSDLMHILEQSATGAHIELEQIPYSRSLFELDLFNRFNFAVSGGDDYELCFTVPPEKRNALKEIAEKLGISVTRIGTVTADRGEITYTLNGIPFDIKTRGYNHFAK
jgi:thiamine-monophosphate kinase